MYWMAQCFVLVVILLFAFIQYLLYTVIIWEEIT